MIVELLVCSWIRLLRSRGVGRADWPGRGAAAAIPASLSSRCPRRSRPGQGRGRTQDDHRAVWLEQRGDEPGKQQSRQSLIGQPRPGRSTEASEDSSASVTAGWSRSSLENPTPSLPAVASWSRSGRGRRTPVIGWPQRGYPPAYGGLRPAGYPAVGARWCRRTRQRGLTQHSLAHASTTARVLQTSQS